MAYLVHNAFYELAVFQANKLFFDNIYWSYSFCRVVGVFYLDFNRHDIQIDTTTHLFSNKTISSPPSNVWQFALQRNQSTVITNAITDVMKCSTWIRCKLNSRINYARLYKIRYKKQTINTIITQAYHSRCTENYEVRPESLQTFQPYYASSKVKNETMPSEIGFPTSPKRRISQPKTQ